MIRFEVGQLPPYLIQQLRAKDRLEREAACDEVAARIARRFEGLEVYGHAVAAYPFDHIGRAEKCA